jgi:hypothetical protein
VELISSHNRNSELQADENAKFANFIYWEVGIVIKALAFSCFPHKGKNQFNRNP